MPRSATTRSAIDRAEVVVVGLAAAERRDDDDRLALDRVRDADRGRLDDRRMGRRRGLDLRRADALAGDLERVVGAAADVPVAVGVDTAQSPWTHVPGQRLQYVSR